MAVAPAQAACYRFRPVGDAIGGISVEAVLGKLSFGRGLVEPTAGFGVNALEPDVIAPESAQVAQDFVTATLGERDAVALVVA